MESCKQCGRPVEKQKRVGNPLCESCARLQFSDLAVQVAPMTSQDLELVHAWRSNPEIYQHFRGQKGPLGWDDHLMWFREREQERHDFVVRWDGRRVGVVSIDTDDFLSVYLGDVTAQGNGVATEAVKWICERFIERAPLRAQVDEANTPSRRLFERCGFEVSEANNGWITYVYESG